MAHRLMLETIRSGNKNDPVNDKVQLTSVTKDSKVNKILPSIQSLQVLY